MCVPMKKYTPFTATYIRAYIAVWVYWMDIVVSLSVICTNRIQRQIRTQCTLVCDQILLLTLLSCYLPAACSLARAHSLSAAAAVAVIACSIYIYQPPIYRSFYSVWVLFVFSLNIYYCYYDSCLIRFRLTLLLSFSLVLVLRVACFST